jgi:6-phosphogluconolactonase
MKDSREVVVVDDSGALGTEAARRVVQAAQEALSSGGSFKLALSGGSTPTKMYEALTSGKVSEGIDWSRTQVFFSDERFVPSDSPESNFRLAQDGLLSRVSIPDRFVHQVPTEGVTPDESASLYEEAIRRVFEIGLGEFPAFDLILLGLGKDGHTASLFPHTSALDVGDRLVVANRVQASIAERVTFTFPTINNAHRVLLMVSGSEKAEAVEAILKRGEPLPAASVHPMHGSVTWLLDKDAAGRLDQPG